MNPADPAGNGDTPTPRRSFRIIGVPIRLHFTFVIFFLFLVTVGARGGQSALYNVVYIAALFTSVLLHELGHAATAKRYNIRTIDIVLYPIGGVARLERSPKPAEELWIALAGPAVNLLIAIALFAFFIPLGGDLNPTALAQPRDSNLLLRIAFGNVVLAIFNMIPAYPMDGGRVLRAVLARFEPEEKATQHAAAAGRILAVMLGLYGLVSMQFMLVFIAFFVYLGAAQESAASIGRTLTQGIPVRQAMITDFRTLEHGATIREAAQMLLSTSQTDFPVVLGHQVLGLLARNALLRGMAADGPEAYVAGVMDRSFPRLSPDIDLNEALPLMAQTSCALVMEGENLLGLLTRENVSEYLMLRRVGMDATEA